MMYYFISQCNRLESPHDRSCDDVKKDLIEGLKILIVDDEPDVLESLE